MIEIMIANDGSAQMPPAPEGARWVFETVLGAGTAEVRSLFFLVYDYDEEEDV